MNITIQDKTDFIDNFVNTIATVADRVQLRIEDNAIHAVAVSQDNTTIICTSYKIDTDITEKTIVNIGDVRLFARTLDVIDSNNVTFQLTKNSLQYKSKTQTLKVHFLEDGIITALPYKKEKLMFDGIKVQLTKDSLKRILRGTSITTHSNKAYITQENNQLFCEFTDKMHENVDSYKELVVANYTGAEFSPIVVKVDSLRIAAKLPCMNTTMRIDTGRGLIAFDEVSATCETSIIFMPLNK